MKTHAQELFVFSESASNIPKNSIYIKLAEHYFHYDRVYDRPANRMTGQLSFGISKKLMVIGGMTLSDMHTYVYEGESYFIYGRYRFLAIDEVNKHFRMAAYFMASRTKAPFHYDEITLSGDKSGIELGIIATKLINKLAISGSISHSELLDSSRFNETIYIPQRMYKCLNYSISGGYRILPLQYTSYKQLNINLYFEILAQQTLDIPKHYLDFAPAIQFIINSNFKVNTGYRFQVAGDMQRMSKDSWTISVERSFLNVFKHHTN